MEEALHRVGNEVSRLRDLERRRASLSRTYELMSDFRLDALGYDKLSWIGLRWRRLKRRVERQFLKHYWSSPPRWRLRCRHLGGQRTLPDFCAIGPIKSGTSDLAVSLMLHPNVIPPLVKEFWSPYPETWRIYYPTQGEKIRHARRFGLALSPYFVPSLHCMATAYNLAKVQPNTKIALVLRDPVERVFSQWKWEHFLTGGRRAASLPFLATFPAYVDRAIQNFPDQPMYTVCGFQVLQTSVYWKAVRHWIECFGAEKVEVFDVGDYFRDRDEFTRRVQRFVGLPQIGTLNSSTAVNQNPISLAPADAGSLQKLKEFFRPYNDKLWEVIGREFAW